jgi:hypothetical protein
MKTMVTVPALASLSAMVSGMRSPFSSFVRTTNWPALALRAMRGASNLKRWMLGTSVFATSILYSLFTPKFGQVCTSLHTSIDRGFIFYYSVFPALASSKNESQNSCFPP